MAHELGHIHNSNSKNPIRSSISKYANDPEVRTSMNNGEAVNKSGLKESGKRLMRGLAILAEESNASRKGLKLMKKHGATKEQLAEAKIRLGKSRKVYEENLKWNVKYPLKNMMKPKE